MIDRMKALVKQQNICVLATVAGSKPYCSLMAYICNDRCDEIYMVTHKQSRKYMNLKENPAVSLLIDTREESPRSQASALTVTGKFEKVESSRKKLNIRTKLLAVHPHLKDFSQHPDAEILRIRIESFLLLNGVEDAYFEDVSLIPSNR
jgi:nitroimidazol reductase NimA-like FMN-containing flavoprotein (pyridoxamine 5'-phosphate oxidase superfamily)